MLTGYAAVFGSLSEDLGGFREVIRPGAFDRALRDRHDVRALVNHDASQILGRTKAGTLQLRVDSKGLLATIDTPDTQVGRDVVTSIKRGDLDGMSFAFMVRKDGDDWSTVGGTPIREVRDLDLVDVSVVATPAYPATSVSARSLAGEAFRTGAPVEYSSVGVPAGNREVLERGLRILAARGQHAWNSARLALADEHPTPLYAWDHEAIAIWRQLEARAR